MTTNPRDRIEDIDARLKELPKGTLTYKTINGKKQPYIQKSVDGKVTSTYVKLDEREQVLLEYAEASENFKPQSLSGCPGGDWFSGFWGLRLRKTVLCG